MSEVKVNKLSPRSGTTVTIGDSGDTINIVGTLQNNGSALPGDISSVVAGTGLSGGGTSGDVTLNVIGGTGITANANDIAIDGTVATLDGTQTLTNKSIVATQLTGTIADARITGAYTGITSLSMTENLTVNKTTGAELILSRNDTSIAVDDLIGGIQFKANDASSSPDPQICGIKAISTGATNTNPKLSFFAGESNYNSNTPDMTIDSSGNITVTGDLIVDTNTLYVKSSNNRVGIGNSNPQNKLHISALTWDDGILIKNTGNFNTGIIADANRSSASGGLLNLQGRWNGTEVTSILLQAGSDTTNKDNGEIVFRTASAGTPTERVRITSDGELLVGKTANNSTVVGVTAERLGNIGLTASSRSLIQANRKDSDGDLINFLKDNTAVGSISSHNGDKIFIGSFGGTNPAGLKFQTQSSPFIAPCTSSGANSDNVQNLGGATARFKDLYLGGGAFIGGTGTANKLDDYEEGTWTPGLTVANAGTSGTYTKIGNYVFARFKVNVNASGSNVAITGLPFASTGATTGEQIGGSRETQTSGKFFFIRVGNNSTEAAIIRYDANVSFTSSQTFEGQAIYLTA